MIARTLRECRPTFVASLTRLKAVRRPCFGFATLASCVAHLAFSFVSVCLIRAPAAQSQRFVESCCCVRDVHLSLPKE